MANSLIFKIKDTVDSDKHRFLELFFADWIDDFCENKFYIVNKKSTEYTHPEIKPHVETFHVCFEKTEDAVAMSLRGIPLEFRQYLEILPDK